MSTDKTAEKKDVKPKKRAVKNLALSFVEDEEVEEAETIPSKKKMKSAHDLLSDEKLVPEDDESKRLREEQEEKRRKEQVSAVRKVLKSKTMPEKGEVAKPSIDERLKEKILHSRSEATGPSTEVQERKEEKIPEDVEEMEKMGFDRLYIKRKKAALETEDTALMDEAERTRSRLRRRKKLYGDRERTTLERLAQFQKTLKTKRHQPFNEETKKETSVNVELPAAWRIGDYLKDAESIGVSDLLSHRLEFDHAKKDSMSRDMHALDDYIVVDTRLEKAAGKDEEASSEKWTGRPNV